MSTLRFTPDPAAIVDPALKEWAEPDLRDVIDTINQLGGYRAAGRMLGRDHAGLMRRIERLQKRAALAGYSPRHGMTETVPDGFKLRGRSVLRKLDPVTGQKVELLSWDKSSADDERRAEMLRAAIDEACQSIPPLPHAPGPVHVAADLLNLYVFTDYHLGMRAWSEEGGADWNLEIAEDLIIRSFAYMLDNTPAAEVGFIGQIGDFAHWDSLKPVTPTSGHVVDASSHYTEVVRAVIRIMRRLVEMALVKHNRVVLLMAEGNHDIASSVWMREIAKSWYANEPRVEVVDSASPFYAYEWGVTMLGFHHGHCAKKLDMAKLFANLFAPMWGRTTKRYGKRGHYHHEVVVDEDGGMKTTQFPTLAPSDSHAARHGYQSVRQTMAETFSRRFGKASEIIVTPEMLCTEPMLEAA